MPTLTPEALELVARDSAEYLNAVAKPTGNLTDFDLRRKHLAEAARRTHVADLAQRGQPTAVVAYNLEAELRAGSKRAAKLATLVERFAAFEDLAALGEQIAALHDAALAEQSDGGK